MLLNIFFDNMNAKLELALIGLFILAVYWFVLRRFNSLGFRLLFLCVFLFAGCCTWLYKDEMSLRNTITKGEEVVATIVSKSISSNKKDNLVEISFTTKDGGFINTSTGKYISQQEWDKLEAGRSLPVIYVPATQEAFVKESILRFKADKIYLYYFAGFWLVLGVVLYFRLHKYKVGVDEKGNEWLEKAGGTFLPDERNSAAYRMAKKGNMISKMIQTFAK